MGEGGAQRVYDLGTRVEGLSPRVAHWCKAIAFNYGDSFEERRELAQAMRVKALELTRAGMHEGYISSALRNLAIDHLRSKATRERRHAPLVVETEGSAGDPSRSERIEVGLTDHGREVRESDTRLYVESVLRTMQPIYRDAAIAYFEHGSMALGAVALGISEKLFKSRLCRARIHARRAAGELL